MKKLLVGLMILTAALSVKAHEGHDHDAPTTLKAPKGGVIKALDEARVEVVSKGPAITIYLYDHDMKPALTADYVLTAKAQHPRTKKEEAVTLTAKDTFYEGSYDGKGVHRYTLKIAVQEKKSGEKYDLTFNIEPRK